jgi:hypothetical protein
MKKQLTLAALIAASLVLTACAKQDNAPASDTEASAVVEDSTVSAEQQAAIDALDQPVLDDKNTDVPAELAAAPADAVTSADAVPASEPVTP